MNDNEEDPTGLTLPPEPVDELEEMTKKVKEHFAKKGRPPVTAENLREMARFCETMTSTMLQMFTALQEEFKKGALAFTQLAEFLEKDADSAEVETAMRNVFDDQDPDDPGPVIYDRT